MHFIGKESLFKEGTFLNWFLRALNGFPIRYGKNDLQVIRHSLEVLKKNEALAIFPEGRRNFDSESALEIQPGTAIIAMKSGAMVVPVVTNRAFRPFRFNRIKIGEAIDPKQFANREDFSKKLQDDMRQLMVGFEHKPRRKRYDRQPVYNARAIVFKDNKLVAIKRIKQGETFYVLPGGHIDPGESARDAVVREITEETSITSIAVRPLYKKMFYRDFKEKGMQVFYLCNYKSGEPKVTDAEEYTQHMATPEGLARYGTYEPVLLDIETLATIDLRPNEIRDQLIKDIKKYGTHLTRPQIYVK